MNMMPSKPVILALLAFAAGWTGSMLITAYGNDWPIAAVNSLLGKLPAECTAFSPTTDYDRSTTQVMSRALDPSAPVTPSRW